MEDKAADQAEVPKVNVTAKTVNQEVVERKVCVLPREAQPAHLQEKSDVFLRECVRQKAYGWESAEVIAGKSAIPKDLM